MNDPFEKKEERIQIITDCSIAQQYDVELKNLKEDVKKAYKNKREAKICLNETLTDDEKRKHKILIRMKEKARKKAENKIN